MYCGYSGGLQGPLHAERYQEQIRLLWNALLNIATTVEKENP
jgi:hypothetical protein